MQTIFTIIENPQICPEVTLQCLSFFYVYEQAYLTVT